MRLPDSREPGKYVGTPIVQKDTEAIVTGKLPDYQNPPFSARPCHDSGD